MRNTWGSDRTDYIIHIGMDENDAEKFSHQAISNGELHDSEKYLTIEEKKGVSQAVLAYRWPPRIVTLFA